MNVTMVLTIVTLLRPVPTYLGVTSVNALKDMLVMGNTVKVRLQEIVELNIVLAIFDTKHV